MQRVRDEITGGNSSGPVPDSDLVSSSASAPTTTATGSDPEEDQVEEVVGHPMNVDDTTQNQNSTGNVPQNGHANNVPEKKPKEKKQELHDADMKIIVHFFAYAPEGMTDDEALWAAINEAVRVSFAC